ncbi:hypothetical protein [Paraburkholderia sp.]|uniref:hypothetical protein n=1 Tax=Paraburkholderia sp. TaxID=1926495 RepID=UPI002ED38848
MVTAAKEIAAMPVCLLRVLPIRFLWLFNTTASDLACREEGYVLARPTPHDKSSGRPPHCNMRHVSFSATGTRCPAEKHASTACELQ